MIGAFILLAVVVSMTSGAGGTEPAQTSATVAAAQPESSQADYRAGYARGESEGADHARSGAGMPIPLGMNWITDMQLQSAHPSDAEAWKNGFKDGFAAGFRSVKSFSRDESKWEQLSWANARPGVRLYDYGGKHEATIRSTDPESGLIVVRYRSGEVEPKRLAAVAPYWWVRKKS